MSITNQLVDLFKAHSGSEKHPELIREESDLLWNSENVQLIEENFVGERRWFNDYEFVYHIPNENRWVVVEVGLGKTEYQDENEIDGVYEAIPREKVTIEYIRKED